MQGCAFGYEFTYLVKCAQVWKYPFSKAYKGNGKILQKYFNLKKPKINKNLKNILVKKILFIQNKSNS